MAKKTAAKAEAAKSKPKAAVSPTDKALMDKYGDGALWTGEDVVENPAEVHSISPEVDWAMNGGMLVGTINTLGGPPSCGKTMTALHAVAKWQAKGKQAYWIAAEPKIFTKELTGVRGLDLSKLKFIGSHIDRTMSASDYLLAAEEIINRETDTLIVIDSFSILSSPAELESKNYDGIPPGGSMRLVGSWCRRMSPIIPIRRHLLIGITQVYTNIGGKTKWKSAIPVKLEHARSGGLSCSWAEPIKSERKDVKQVIHTGQIIHWKVERSALGAPGGEAKSILRYGYGIDETMELVNKGVELALIEGTGWYELSYLGDDAPDKKFQGKEKVWEYLEEHEDARVALRKVLDERMKA